MPIPRFTMPEAYEDDGALRTRLIQETNAFLNYIVVGDEEDRWDGLLGHRVPFLSEAWTDVAGSFNELADSVTDIDPKAVTRHGIGGAQLKFKLANVALWSERLGRDFSLGKAYRWRLPGRWRDYIDYLLESIDTILESILDALGFGSAPSEMKEAIANSIKWLFDE